MSLQTPDKPKRLQASLYHKAKQEPSGRFHFLYDKVWRTDILAHAYALNRQKDGAPGVDGQTFADMGLYYCKAHVRKLFNHLDRWIVQRLWSHRHRRWRCAGWQTLPRSQLYAEYGLVNLVSLIPSLSSRP